MTHRRLFIHIGAPKTGSTYLQRRWRGAAAQLRQQAIYLPVLPMVARMAGNAKLLPMVLDGAPTPSFQRAFPDIDPKRLDPQGIVDALLSDWRQAEEDVLLTAENFRRSHARLIRELLPVDTEVVPILFVRPQDAWVNSYYNQLIKTGDIDIGIEPFVEHLLRPDEGRADDGWLPGYGPLYLPDWHGLWRAWSEAFGRCEVVFFNEAVDDLNGAFLRSAGRTDIRGLPDIAPAQPSLGLNALAYLRERGGGAPFAAFRQRAAACQAAAAQLGEGRPASLISPRNRRRLRARFAASNAELLAAAGHGDRADFLAFAPDETPFADLTAVQADPDYLRFRDLADAAFLVEA